MKFVDRVREAEARIRPHARETPLIFSPTLSEKTGGKVWLKLENLQHTGSFKLRGALNKMFSLTEEERARGVVTASTGNHGAATAYAGQLAGVAPTVYVPEGAMPSKIRRIRDLGGKVSFHGIDSAETERRAREVARESGQVFLSPYNDWDVMAGQGTIGAELERQCPGLDAVIVAVGGGGLIGGIAGYLTAVRPGITVIACQPRNSAVMAASVAAGEILDLPSEPTLSDGTAGGVEAGTITFEFCRTLVRDWDLIDEDAIHDGVRWAFEAERLIVEGAAGVAIASALAVPGRLAGKNVAVVICGGNVGLDVWCRTVEPSRREAGGQPSR